MDSLRGVDSNFDKFAVRVLSNVENVGDCHTITEVTGS